MKTIIHKINKSFYYGWVIVVLSAMTFFLSAPGQTYSISVFIDVYIDEFEFSRTLISSAYSIATVMSGIMLVFMGKAIDRYGVKRILIIVTINFTGNCLRTSKYLNFFHKHHIQVVLDICLNKILKMNRPFFLLY